MPKKGGLGQFADLRGVCQERGGGGFWGGEGGGDTPMPAMLLDQTEGERRALFWGSRKSIRIVRLPPGALGCHKKR